MSFGIALVDKDMVFNGDGKVKIVENENKLLQDLDKIIRTQQGTSYLHPTYGSTIYDIIGKKITASLMTSLFSKNLSFALQYFFQVQQNQRVLQYVTPKEIMMNVDSVVIKKMEPTRIVMDIAVRTLNGSQIKALTTVSEGV